MTGEVTLEEAAIRRLMQANTGIAWIERFAQRFPKRVRDCRCQRNSPEYFGLFNDFKTSALSAASHDQEIMKRLLGADKIRVVIRAGRRIEHRRI